MATIKKSRKNQPFSSARLFRGLFALIFVFSLIGMQQPKTVQAEDYLASCTGACTITTSGSSVIYTFTGNGTLTPSTALSANILVVAGGGGGGGKNNIATTYGGGGGAGGVIAQNGVSLSINTYTVTVGVGGTSGTNNTKGGNGGNSVFGSYTATGGGGGGTAYSGQTTGNDGGSGGGGGVGGSTAGPGGAGTDGQGTAGAGATTDSPKRGGGGGGAGAAGSAQNGGDGISSAITGTTVTYAGGGGGGGGTAGTAGTGGGGAGNSSGAGTAGAANTGGGGGGAGSANTTTYTGGAGGSGIVIISYNLAPTITITGTLTAFSSEPGTPSPEQSYSVSGTNLAEDISITAPTDFEISATSGSGFGSSVTLSQSGGVVASTLIYVRFNRAVLGTSSGDISHVSSGASTVNLAVSGTAEYIPLSLTFQDGVDGYSGTRDTYIFNTSPSTVRGSETTFVQDYDTATVERRSLLLFDLSSIPAGATITSAEFDFYVTAEGQGFNMYRMLVPWDEASVTYESIGNRHFQADDVDAESSIDTSWTGHDGLTEFSSVSIPAETIQDWVDGTLPNYGWMMIATDIPGGDGQQLASRENGTQDRNPKLIVNYFPSSSNSTITISGTPLTPFSSTPGTPSAEQSYSVSGSNLSDDILITAPANFEVSTTSGSGFASEVILSKSAGSVPPTPIYVRYYRATAGESSGNITHTSTDAVQKDVAVSGTAMTGWVAYNDCAFIDGQTTSNITTYQCYTNGAGGELTDYYTGLGTGVTLSVSTSGTVESQITSDYIGEETNSGTDAYIIFHDFVNMVGGGRLTKSDTGTVTLAFAGLDPAKTYSLVATANRGNTDYTDRESTFLLADALTAINASTTGVTVGTKNFAEDSTSFCTGYNTENGYVARWTGIDPGPDGDFSLTTTATGAGDYGYMPAVFMLQEGSGEPSVQHTLTVGDNGHGSVTLSPPGGVYYEGATVTLTPVPDTGFVFGSWSGLNDTDLVDNGNGTWSISMDADKSVTANFLVSSENVAPDQPQLVLPVDDATNVPTSPSLQVTASDPNVADTLNVSFYGRLASGTTPEEDFTLVVLPDIQNESQYNTAMLTSQMNWIKDHYTTDNIVFVTSVGDLVNTASDTTQYNNADAGFDILDTGGVPYSVSPGNHDMGAGSLYNNDTYFGIARFTSQPWYQGHYGSDNYNNYSFFSADGMDFILINLQYTPSTDQINWADALLKANPGKRGIVVQHDILNTNDSWNNQASFTALKDNPNLFMMLCGHMHAATDGAAYRAELGDDGHTIHVVMQDYQDFSNGNGWLRIYRFSPADDMIYMTTYSPYVPGSITTDPDQKNLAYEMEGNSDPFTLIDTVSSVTNGDNVSVSWPGLLTNTEYEWYATVSDGSLASTGSVWSFTTGTDANTQPVADNQSVTTDEDTGKEITLTGSDANSDPLTYSVGTPSHGSLAGTAPQVTYTPDLDYFGPDSFTFTVNDGSEDSLPATVSITISAINDAPVANPQNVQTQVNTPVEITLTGTDVDNTTLNYLVVDGPTNGSISGSGSTLSYTPDLDYSGSDSFTFKINDGALDSNIAEISIVVNPGSPPSFPSSFYGEIHIYDNPPIVGGTVLAYVPGVADTAASATITNDAGNLVYTINVPQDDGIGDKQGGIEGDLVTFKIGDRILATGVWHAGTNTEINFHPPEALPGGPYIGTAGAAIAFSGSANDWASDAVTYQWDWNNDSVYDETGSSPNHTWSNYGAYTVGLKVSDSIGGEGKATVDVAINNLAPVLGTINSKSINELSQLAFTATATDHDPFTFSLTGAPTGASITSGGNFTWTPTEAQGPGDFTFTVKVCDDQTPAMCAEEDITVTVNEVNVAPVLAGIGSQSVAELANLNFTASATDDDLPANSLSFSLANGSIGSVPAGAAIGLSGGDFSWTPNEAQGAGSYIFDVCVSDEMVSDCETITVTVSEVNSAPVLDAIGSRSVAELDTLTFNAHSTDGDLPANTLTYSLEDAPVAASIVSSTGSFTWTPGEADGPGSYPFTVKVCDNGDPSICDFEEITVTVSEVNVEPVLAGIGNKSVAELSLLTFTASATDDDLPANTLTFSLVDAPTGASIVPTTGVFSWTPGEAQGPASYTFSVKVCDDGLPTSLCGSEEITVTVLEGMQTTHISLVIGWNLVSFDLQPVETGIADALDSITGNYDLVYAWDSSGAHSSSGNWMKYAPLAPEFTNTLNTLDETMGFWVHMTAADVLEVTGQVPDNTSITLTTQAGGWNLVGFPSTQAGALPAILSNNGVNDDFTLIYAFHAADATDNWKIFDREAPSWANDLTELAPGWGYWVKVSANHTWTVSY